MRHPRSFLTQFSTSGHIFKLALPAIVSQISKTFLQVADSMFIGRLGTLELGAVALVTTITWAILTTADGFAVGLTASVARMTGAGEPAEGGMFFRTGLAAMGILSLILAPACIIFSQNIFRVVNMPAELFSHAGNYMNTFLAFLPFIFLLTALEASFRGSGDTRTPMLVGLLINAVNIFLDWTLIFGKFGLPAMGVRGAALATGISFSLGCFLLYFLSRKRPWGRRKADARIISLSHLGRIVRISIPSSLEQLAMSVSQLIVMAVAVNPLGSSHVASFHIVMRLASLSFMPGFGFAIAASTLTGQSLGQHRPGKAARLLWHSVLFSTLVMAVISICYFAFPETLVGLFSPDKVIHNLSRGPMRVYALFGVFLGPTMVLGGGLRGAGDTKHPMIYMMISRFCIRIPLAWLLSIRAGLGLVGIWIAICSDFLIRAVLLTIHALRGKWKDRKI